jgi:hypothetical protein
MSLLTEADKQLLPLALRQNGGFHIASKWYFKDWEPMWYQYLFHQALQPNSTFLAGIATGKTTIVAASLMMDCITIPYFRGLNTSVTAKQSELPFEMIQPWLEGNPRLEHLVEDVALRPYPTIKFKNFSELVFRTAGKDARFIRGMEFDRINYDESGLDFPGETMKVLRGRLRGERPDKTKRMNRLDTTTSPTDAPWLRERFERGIKGLPGEDLRHYFSLRVRTYDNTHLTRDTIELMEKEYSDDMIDVELGAQFPDYGMSMFPKSHLNACMDQSLYDAAYEALHPEEGTAKRGYRIEEHPRYGIVHFELPYLPGHKYVLAGDPGTDGPPHRNAGVVLCFDVTQRPIKLCYFDWCEGKGSYAPFLNSFKYVIDKYYPDFRGIDTTGTQKAIDELAFENHGIHVDGISFNSAKDGMLNCLINDVTEHNFRAPLIQGFLRQMSTYSRENDKKLAQDIVMTMAQVSYLARLVDPGLYEDKQNLQTSVAARWNRKFRSNINRVR